MKKSYYLLLFILMLSAAAKAQTNWVTKDLDEKLSIKFPSEPQKVTKNGIYSYTLKGKDSVGYNAAVMDYKVVAHLDSATLAPMKDTQEFADQIRMGMASKKANYTFGDVTIGKWKTYTTYSISASENTNKNKLLIQIILIGSKMYSLSCLVPANLVTKNNEVFLGSVDVLKK
jgi:hypothetical protein